jgi:hypothetical protein
MKPIYDPFEFIGKIELFTIAIIGSFITMKLLNALYETIYEPMVDVLVDSDKTDSYYVRIGNYYVQIGMVIKEFIKWFLLIIILMIIYNLFMHRYFH